MTRERKLGRELDLQSSARADPDVQKAKAGSSTRITTSQKGPKKISSNAQYAKANYKTLKLYVSAEERDAIKAYAESQGMSVNKLLLTALEEYKANHGEK